jgi:hypothetical protein
MRPTLIAATVALLAACDATLPLSACEAPDRRCLDSGDVEVVDRATGEVLPMYWHDGQRWIAGIPGHRYAIRLHNPSWARQLAVVSVDGINAVSGETAGWYQSGYVLTGQESFDVLGWRKTQERVADFVFSDVAASYAARSGRPGNVGVIGVAVFREAPPPVTLGRAENSPEPARESADAAATPRAQAPSANTLQRRMAPSAPTLGTGHGASEYSYVGSTQFTRANEHPDIVYTVRYERPERLAAMGIVLEHAEPSAFPQSASNGFVPDPPRNR